MKLYHQAKDPQSLQSILEGGFRDEPHEGHDELVGVYFTDQPLELRPETAMVVVEAPDEEIARYERIESGEAYREFLIPAAVANAFSRPTAVTHEELQAIEKEREAQSARWERSEAFKEMLDKFEERGEMPTEEGPERTGNGEREGESGDDFNVGGKG